MKCLKCGAEINGPSITTPVGDTYHYGCCEVEYPKECGVDKKIREAKERGNGDEIIEFYEYFRENPYNFLGDEGEELKPIPKIHFRHKPKYTIEILGTEIYTFSLPTQEYDVTEIFLHVLLFGTSLERDFPIFADLDELYPSGNARVPPGEETYSEDGVED